MTELDVQQGKKKNKDNCIEGILQLMKLHEMDVIRIFSHRSLSIKTLGAAFALSDFLKHLNINCEVVIEHTENVKNGLPPTEKIVNERNFIAIAVDCRKYGDIENLEYQKSYILLNIFGPSSTKGFGVLNFVRKDVSGAAEVLYQDITTYCKNRKLEFPLSTAQFLYLSIIGGTKRFGNNIRSNTFQVAQELLSYGVNYQLANELFEYKNETILRCQELILKNLKKNGKIMTVIIDDNEFDDDLKLSDFKDALDTFRCVKEVIVWICLIENKDHYYHVFIQGKETNPFPVSRIAIKNNGSGDHTDAECIIQIGDFNKILRDTSLLVPSEDKPILLNYCETPSMFYKSNEMEEDEEEIENDE